MTGDEKEVFQRVQAALLDSESPPREAVRMALRAIVGFADGEDAFLSPSKVALVQDAVSHGEAAQTIAGYRKALDDSAIDELTALLKEEWDERER